MNPVATIDTNNLKTNPVFKDDSTYNSLIAEYKWLCQTQEFYMKSIHTNIKLFIMIIGVLFSILVAKQSIIDPSFVFIIIPTMLFIFAIIQKSYVYVLIVLTYHRKLNEASINKLIGESILTWEAETASMHLNKLQTLATITTLPVFSILTAVFVVTSIKAYQSFGCISLCLHVAEFLFMVIAFAQLLKSQRILSVGKPI